jgi:hypothetical protein
MSGWKFATEPHSAPERTGIGPFFLPERPVKDLDTVVLPGRPQPRDRCAGAGMIKCVSPVPAFGG